MPCDVFLRMRQCSPIRFAEEYYIIFHDDKYIEIVIVTPKSMYFLYFCPNNFFNTCLLS